MIDMKPTILAKSDQLNSDDLIAGPITVKILEVREGSGKDQPISIHYEGDNNRPYKPCKTMRRVLVHAWGDDGQTYVGRFLTLYREPTVKWAGEEIGGLRISHMSDIDQEMTVTTQLTRGKKGPWTVRPLQIQKQETSNAETEESKTKRLAVRIIRAIESEETKAGLIELWERDYAEDINQIKTASETTFNHMNEKYDEKMKGFTE